MARYHFYISNGHPFSDSEGQEFPNDRAAWNEALRTVHDIESTLDLDKSRHWSLEVTRDGTAIFRIDVSAQRLEQIAN
jgi:hypothetical protein